MYLPGDRLCFVRIHKMEKTIKQEILVDPILEDKTRKTFERISENLHILANDPSLAFYRLQENTRRSMPRIIERRVEAEKLQHELQGNCYDIEYAIDQINTMKSTVPTFKHILELAKAVVSLRQKLTYLKNKRSALVQEVQSDS